MPRRKNTEEEIRASLASVRTMLSDARIERDRALDALDAVLDAIGGCICGQDIKARQAAREALTRPRAVVPSSDAGGGVNIAVAYEIAEKINGTAAKADRAGGASQKDEGGQK